MDGGWVGVGMNGCGRQVGRWMVGGWMGSYVEEEEGQPVISYSGYWMPRSLETQGCLHSLSAPLTAMPLTSIVGGFLFSPLIFPLSKSTEVPAPLGLPHSCTCCPTSLPPPSRHVWQTVDFVIFLPWSLIPG